MSIDSYSALQTAVGKWLDRSDLADDIPLMIQMGEGRIYRDLRIACMESSLNVTIASGVAALPTRYRELKFAYIDGSPAKKLERKDAEWIYHSHPDRSAGGIPKYIARDGANFIFGPFPTDGSVLKGTVYSALAPLSDSNAANWFIDNAPELLVFAALCEAEPFLKNDERVALWEAKYKAVASALQRQDDAEEFSGSPLSSTVR